MGGATTDISQKVVEVGEYEKRDRLSEILQNMGKEEKLISEVSCVSVQTPISIIFSVLTQPLLFALAPPRY